MNSVTRNVVKPHEMHILKKDSEFSIKPKYEFNGQLKDKLSANEYTVNESKNISVSSADQPLNKKFLLTRNEKVKNVLEVQCMKFCINNSINCTINMKFFFCSKEAWTLW